MKIADALVPALKAAFSASGLEVLSEGNLVARFPAAHEAVGPITIYDDGDEVTLVLGEISHSHFNAYGESVDEVTAVQLVVEMVVSFLRELFSNRVLLWVGEGGVGGWCELGDEQVDKKNIGSWSTTKLRYFLWSGPLP